MNKSTILMFLLGLGVSLTTGSLLIGFGESFANSNQYTEIQIPSWVKHSAGWWSEDRISDQDYLKSIQYLIDQGIIKIK